MGVKEAIDLAIEEVREKERYEKMCEMITMNFPIESIAKLYKVTVDYVLNLKKELDNNEYTVNHAYHDIPSSL